MYIGIERPPLRVTKDDRNIATGPPRQIVILYMRYGLTEVYFFLMTHTAHRSSRRNKSSVGELSHNFVNKLTLHYAESCLFRLISLFKYRICVFTYRSYFYLLLFKYIIYYIINSYLLLLLGALLLLHKIIPCVQHVSYLQRLLGSWRGVLVPALKLKWDFPKWCVSRVACFLR